MSNPSDSIETGIALTHEGFVKQSDRYDRNEPLALRMRHRLVRELQITRRESPKI